MPDVADANPLNPCPTCGGVVTWGTSTFLRENEQQLEIYTCARGHSFKVPVEYQVPDIEVAEMPISIQQEHDPAGAVHEMNMIKVALGKVAVYEDMVGLTSTVLLVEELVRDHEELEARIDAAMSYLASLDSVTYKIQSDTVSKEVARLLRGGQRVPDTLEGFDG